ncbi:MAG: DUF3179 domain-containing protein [Candidatus Pacebacteria bacterium]|jgi:hypothetical protein|nr:DUF3179 domain-containing protein [Candidatus Paceibacterota bacterium]MBT4652191.1 DUF3179 domain-containing protein [Candidatus Paceibacterota bacterium]MBT6756622.1 DUF3179 domain-containing protein [Candidatus Paceibacterota bacterium]MBT6920872.1 DUF3179 domain-containing protein [Candidatus Paceibacterota bacterium]
MKQRKIYYFLILLSLGWLLGSLGFKKYFQYQKLKSFRTDFSQKSISLNKLTLGKVGKDDIPDISNPKFVSVDEASIKDSMKGVLVDISGKKRFYPLNILVWHEVINDFMEGVPIAVTYSPLCDSVTVFRSSSNNQGLKFRASGFLYNANLVFYDTKTESFWLQATGQAIAGQFDGNFLSLVPGTQVLSFAEIKKNHSDAQILSQDTGYFNNYSFNPYSGYTETDEIPDFVKYENKRFSKKQRMFVVPLGEKSLVFPLDSLPTEEVRSRIFDGTFIRAGKSGSEVIVTQDGKRVGGYSQMWFCWAASHEENGVVWDMSSEEVK